MFRDRLLAAALAGITGTIVDGAIHFAAIFLRIAHIHTTTGHYLAQIIFAADRLEISQVIAGELAHLIAGGALGTAVLLLLLFSGNEYAVVKGAALGAVFWLNHAVIIPSLAAKRSMLRRSVPEAFVDLAALIAWGAVTAAVYRRLTAGPSRTGSPRRT